MSDPPPPPPSTTPGQPRQARVVRGTFALHRISGLLVGLLLLVVGLSGSALVFEEEIDHALFRGLHEVQPQARRLSYDAIYRSLWQAYPDASSVWFRRLPLVDTRSLEAMIEHATPPGGIAFRYVYIDPYTGHTLGSRPWPSSFAQHPTGWLLRLHYTLLLGKAGEWFVGLAAVLLFVSITTGFIVYRSFIVRVLTFRIRPRWRQSKQLLSDLHRVVGVWAWLFNLIIAITGFWFTRHVWKPSTYAAAPAAMKVPRIDANIDDLFDRARAQAPRFVPWGFRPFVDGTGELMVDVHGDDRDRLALQAPQVSASASTPPRAVSSTSRSSAARLCLNKLRR